MSGMIGCDGDKCQYEISVWHGMTVPSSHWNVLLPIIPMMSMTAIVYGEIETKFHVYHEHNTDSVFMYPSLRIQIMRMESVLLHVKCFNCVVLGLSKRSCIAYTCDVLRTPAFKYYLH